MTKKHISFYEWSIIAIAVLVIIAYFVLVVPEKNRERIKLMEAEMTGHLDRAMEYKIVLETLKYYRENHSNNGFNQNIKHLEKVWFLCFIYAKLIEDATLLDTMDIPEKQKQLEREKICNLNIPLFMFSVCSDETNFNPNAIAYNKDGSFDIGITQINEECVDSIEKQLTPDLREQHWTDLDKNIAGRYIWIMDRIKMGMKWDIMTEERGWKFYHRLNKASKKYREKHPCL